MTLDLVKNSFLPFSISFLIALTITPLVIFFYRRFGWLEYPKRKKDTHERPVPRGGGIPIFLALVVASLIFLPVDKHLAGILLGATLATVIGILDDRFNLNPYLRLLSNFLVAGAVVGAGIGIAFITNPLDGIIRLDQPQISFYLLGKTRSLWILSDLFALIWIAWCMNFVGWAGGIEGQFPGFVSIAALTIWALSFRFSADITQWPVMVLAVITAGAYLGFLPFNFYPQKIMPGYGGKSLGGFLLATLSILSTTKVGTLLVVLGIPLVDALYSISRRILARRSPVWGDRGHLHHRLLDLGWGRRRIAVFYWLITAILGTLALFLNSRQKFYTIVMIGAILGSFFLWLKYFTTSPAQPDQDHG